MLPSFCKRDSRSLRVLVGLPSVCQPWSRLEFPPARGCSRTLASSCCGSQPSPAHSCLAEQARLQKANCEEAFVSHRGLAMSRVGSRSWNEDQVAQIPDPTVLGLSLIIYLETKRHCLPGAVCFIAAIFQLPYFTTRPQGRREAQLLSH